MQLRNMRKNFEIVEFLNSLAVQLDNLEALWVVDIEVAVSPAYQCYGDRGHSQRSQADWGAYDGSTSEHAVEQPSISATLSLNHLNHPLTTNSLQ